MTLPQLTISPKDYESVLDACSQQADVAQWVRSTHDESLWWPLSIRDQRTRMLVAGYSTRISYRMLTSYRRVVDELGNLTWQEIECMDEGAMRQMVRSLGLPAARLSFWRSLIDFFHTYGATDDVLPHVSNDELIALIAKSVKGASYKVAQCCVLYARGYYCGVMPVDSGMKDRLLPCLGFPAGHGALGHETLRKQLEKLTSLVDVRAIAVKNGYGDLALPVDRPLTWWAHLVLIYFKRLYCNERRWRDCPLRDVCAGSACREDVPRLGGRRLIILEGVDGAGKTTLANAMRGHGFLFQHADFHSGNIDLVKLYEQRMRFADSERRCFDRSFISEEAYGPVLRGASRFSHDQLLHLLGEAREAKAMIVYLYASKSTCIERTKGPADKALLESHYDSLRQQYDLTLRKVSSLLPVASFDTDIHSTDDILRELGL